MLFLFVFVVVVVAAALLLLRLLSFIFSSPLRLGAPWNVQASYKSVKDFATNRSLSFMMGHLLSFAPVVMVYNLPFCTPRTVSECLVKFFALAVYSIV
mmetsp:Transcript_15309/g.31750  ORF Transcript_15309/g.31750 Transcript_15309/m.31750 type:complete len:98 (+) Transcript_15309:64-357(+)